MGKSKVTLPQDGETTPFLKNVFCFLLFRDRMGDFHDPRREKITSQFMLLECTFQMSQTIHLDFFGQEAAVVEHDLMVNVNVVLLLTISLVGTNGYCQIINTTNIQNLIQ
jgi:hypothetical protein